MGHVLGLNPAGVSLFRMHRSVHVFGVLKFQPTEAEAVHCTAAEGVARVSGGGSGPSVFNGFEGRVRHTLASHPGPFWATSWA